MRFSITGIFLPHFFPSQISRQRLGVKFVGHNRKILSKQHHSQKHPLDIELPPGNCTLTGTYATRDAFIPVQFYRLSLNKMPFVIYDSEAASRICPLEKLFTCYNQSRPNGVQMETQITLP